MLCYGTAEQEETKLINKLFKKYEPLVRPASRVNKNVTVHFSVALNQIVSLDDQTGTLIARFTLRMVSQ